MLAETIRSQLIEPLDKSIKSMQLSKKTIQADLDMLFDECDDATHQYNRCKRAVDKADIVAQQAHEKLDAATSQPVVNPQHADRLRLHVQKADDAADLARSHLRQAEERLRATTARHHATEYPRVLQALRKLESQRSYDAFKAVHGLVAAERDAGVVVSRGIEEMGELVAAVDLAGDLQRYDDIYCGAADVQMQRIDTADSQTLIK